MKYIQSFKTTAIMDAKRSRLNLVPRVYSAFKMAAEGALSRHLESGVDPGNEVGRGFMLLSQPRPQGLLLGDFKMSARREKTICNAELTPLLIGPFIRTG